MRSRSSRSFEDAVISAAAGSSGGLQSAWLSPSRPRSRRAARARRRAMTMIRSRRNGSAFGELERCSPVSGGTPAARRCRHEFRGVRVQRVLRVKRRDDAVARASHRGSARWLACLRPTLDHAAARQTATPSATSRRWSCRYERLHRRLPSAHRALANCLPSAESKVQRLSDQSCQPCRTPVVDLPVPRC